MTDPDSLFDYIVVGAVSSSGGVAARLSEAKRNSRSACVIEAGGVDKSRLIRAPTSIAALMRRRGEVNRGFEMVPRMGLDGH